MAAEPCQWGEHAGECKLAAGHDGPHTDGTYWYNEDAERVEKPERELTKQIRRNDEHHRDPGIAWVRQTKALRPGDPCEWRYPARKDWHPGDVVKNGGGYYWEIRDTRPDEEKDQASLDMEARKGDAIKVLYIEFVKSAGGDHYEDGR